MNSPDSASKVEARFYLHNSSSTNLEILMEPSGLGYTLPVQGEFLIHLIGSEDNLPEIRITDRVILIAASESTITQNGVVLHDI